MLVLFLRSRPVWTHGYRSTPDGPTLIGNVRLNWPDCSKPVKRGLVGYGPLSGNQALMKAQPYVVPSALTQDLLQKDPFEFVGKRQTERQNRQRRSGFTSSVTIRENGFHVNQISTLVG